MSENFHAYVAGFLDADGHISIVSANRGTSVSLTVAFTNRHKETLDEIRNAFGGSMDTVNNSTCPSRTLTMATLYVYRQHGVNCEALLRAVLPYIRQKHRRAELALELITLTKNKAKWRFNPEDRAKRFEILKEAKYLNGCGVDYPYPVAV